MKVIVTRGNVEFTCTSEEQLKSFLEDGYKEKQPEAEKPKAAAPKKPKTK